MAKLIFSSTESRLPYILLGVSTVLILLLGASIIICTHRATKHVEINEDLSSRSIQSQVISEIEKTTMFLNLTSSSSTMYLTRVLSSSLKGSKLSFSDIEKNVAPSLFQVLSITPHLTQISFIEFEGLFFSYYKDGDQTFALYSNSSVGHTYSLTSSPSNTNYCYTQLVNRDTGKLYGNVVRSFPSTVVTDSSWFREALESKSGSHAFLGTNWNDGQDLLFINSSNVNNGNNLGLVSLGFSVQEVTRYYKDINLQGGKSCLITRDGKSIAGDSIISYHSIEANNSKPSVSCYSNGTLSSTRASHLNTDEVDYIIRCSQLDILGVQSVYVLAIQKSGFINSLHRFRTIALLLLILTIAIMIIVIFSFLPIIHRGSKREAYLSLTLVKQKNAAEQAERKSTKKAHAFATASHDIRASLAGMIGLIEICYGEVASGSELETNLRQLEGCTKDLSSMLTSILDSSKIEAGKMLLEEEEFNVAKLFEDVVDLYHPVGAKKGVDVILDPCDGSVSKFSHVKCDRVKLRQILSNLLSNAVKFTSEGQIVVRAQIRKPKMKNSTIASNQSTNYGLIMRSLAFICFKNKKENENKASVETIEDDPNSMELVCEVDDTGKGIPKEKRNEVFENYVQVKETALGQGGTGLGLGIVQSLVRLMHGEIGIVDKDVGENGSCFRFNISLSISGNILKSSKENLNENNELVSSTSAQLGPQVMTLSPGDAEGSYVVLLIQNDERRRISEKFMESLGIKVFPLKCPDQLPHTLKRIQRNWNRSVSDFGTEIESLMSKPLVSRANSRDVFIDNDVPFSNTISGEDYLRSLVGKTTNNNHLQEGTSSILGFVLLVVDDNVAETFSELCDAVIEFRNSLQISAYCAVVWIANHASQNAGFKSSMLGNSDDIIIKHKPLHGSRLYDVVSLLPEFGGPTPKKAEKSLLQVRDDIDHHDQISHDKPGRFEIEEVGFSRKEAKPLSGKTILVVDDTLLQRKIAMYTVEKLGGTVVLCAHGLEAFELVCNELFNLRKQGDSMIKSSGLLYDCILMDCEMPVMNGYDATREIRKVEMLYGVHTPIIALTAHMPGSEEADQTFAAGMDAFLCRPLNDNALVDVINRMANENFNN